LQELWEKMTFFSPFDKEMLKEIMEKESTIFLFQYSRSLFKVRQLMAWQ